MANDYFDHRSGNDEKNQYPTPFSGGSRVIQEGLLPPRSMLVVSISFFVLSWIIGLYLNSVVAGNIILVLGLIGTLAGFFYTAAPLRIGYTGLGEFIVGLCFGPLVVLGSYYVQTENLSWHVVLSSLPVGILITAVLYINEFPDYEADKAVAKHTLVVRLGCRRAVKVYYILIIASYLTLLLGILLRTIPLLTLSGFLTVPIAWRAINISRRHYANPTGLIPAMGQTILLHFLMGIFLCGGVVLHRVLT
jgi:1,4-dihydroxy-2-naphthoate octaprenyltransferase